MRALDSQDTNPKCEYCGAPTGSDPGVVVVEPFRELEFCDRACHEPWAAGGEA